MATPARLHSHLHSHLHVRLDEAALRSWPQALAQVQRLEQDGVAAVLLPIVTAGLEPLTLAAGLATQTRRIGLVVGVDPALTLPYTAARRLAALDHASAGRTGWFLAQPSAPTAPTEPARAADYLATVLALWDSWDDGLHRIDRAAGRYIDTTGIRPADHRGPFYASAGPLDIPRPPQGHPVFYAAQAAPGVDMLLPGDNDKDGDGDSDPASAAPATAPTGPRASTATPATLRAQLGLPPAPPPAHAHAR